MQTEKEVIDKLGIVTSADVRDLLEKSIQAVIRQLNSLENIGLIRVVTFSSEKHRKKIYMKNELYNNIHKIA